uniref:Uncharacterized protein n=1 Tax=viral metagenome TaxID=1070528 RepID=A0A6C0CGM8_9ZZZZ
MDPLLDYARRDSNSYPYLRYDGIFIYERDDFAVDLNIKFERENQLPYVDGTLRDHYKSLVDQVHIPDFEAVLRERANPLVALPRLLNKGDSDLYIFRKIFGLQQGSTVMVRPGFRIADDVLTHLLHKNPPQNFIVSVPDVVDAFWADLVYLLTKFYSQSTLLQLTCSKTRYLICIKYVGTALVKHETLRLIIEKTRLETDIVSQLLTKLPDTFESWLTFMNNTHLSMRSEFNIRLIDIKTARDSGNQYWTGVSYDVFRAKRFLLGEDVEPKLFLPKDLVLSDAIDEPFVTDMHLYGNSVDHTDRKLWPLHEVIDFERDQSELYRSTRSMFKSGIHWGQRKLLMAEVDFFASKSEKGESSLAIYVGAAPFEHGSVLFEWFPTMKFILVDPREGVWDSAFFNRETGESTNRKVVIKSVYFDNELARQVGLWFSQDDLSKEEPNIALDVTKMRAFVKGVKKVFFISDIRRGSYEVLGLVGNELMVHEDMTWQKQWAEIIHAKLSSLGGEISPTLWCSLKFRLPFIEEIGGMDYQYGNGELHTQPWSRLTSVELRLWWNPVYGDKSYNKKKLEDIMMYHNHQLRAANYGPPNVEGYCKCHDCHYEIDIITRFVRKFRFQEGKFTVSDFTKQIDKIMGKTLTQHAENDRNPNKIRMIGEEVKEFRPSNTRGKFIKIYRFRPMRENVLALNTSRLESELIKILGDKKNARDFLITLWILYGRINQEDITSDLVVETNVEPIRKAISDYIQWQNDDLSKIPEDEKVEATAGQVKGHADFYTLTAAKESTMTFPKDILPRFLVKRERAFGIGQKEIRTSIYRALPRSYCVLKFYEAIWDDHFALCPNQLFAQYRDLLEGNSLGFTILSTYLNEDGRYNEKFMALNTELELLYTVYTNILAERVRVLDNRTLLVFLPKIRLLQQKAIKILLDALAKYEKSDRSIIFLLPQSYVDLIPEDKRSETLPYEGSFQNSITGKEQNADPKDPYMIVRSSTQSATYKLK